MRMDEPLVPNGLNSPKCCGAFVFIGQASVIHGNMLEIHGTVRVTLDEKLELVVQLPSIAIITRRRASN
jgi:hypothetical protein